MDYSSVGVKPLLEQKPQSKLLTFKTSCQHSHTERRCFYLVANRYNLNAACITQIHIIYNERKKTLQQMYTLAAALTKVVNDTRELSSNCRLHASSNVSEIYLGLLS